MTYSTQDAEKTEAQMFCDALIDGSFELTDAFLDRYAGEDVKQVLLSLPEKDRAFHLNGNILDEHVTFPGSVIGAQPDAFLLPCDEIEVQFGGKADEYFEDAEDWHIDGNLAYLYTGYGCLIPVDVEGLKASIEERND